MGNSQSITLDFRMTSSYSEHVSPSRRLGGLGVVVGLTVVGVVTGGAGVIAVGSLQFPGVSLISSNAMSLR